MTINRVDFIGELFQQIKFAVSKCLETKNKFDSYEDFKEFVINEIVSLTSRYEMMPIRQEVVMINNKKDQIDLVIYKDDISFVSIEVCWSYIGKAIAKLLANQSEHYVLVSIFPDKSLPTNLLRRFDLESKIKLLHLPKIKLKNDDKQKEFKFSTQRAHYSIVDSPLELMFTQKLKEMNMNFISQYAVYERAYTGVMKSYPKYIVDFVVKGEFCKLAIECDGLYYHLRDFQRAYDTERDLWLLKTGFDDVLRFFGDEIRDNLDGCIEKIKKAVEGWDNYYKRKQQKTIIQTSEMSKVPNREDVKLIVNELASLIASAVNQINKREMRKNATIILQKIKKLILKSGYSNEIPLLYYTFPELSKYVDQTQGLFIGYNIPFVIDIVKSELKVKMPPYLKREKRILKLIIVFDGLSNRIANVESYIIINGWTGKVMKSDILNVDTLNDSEKENGEMAKQKYYVVWSGKQTGIFKTWDECKKQVIGVKGAKYKAFSTEQEANEAFQIGYASYKQVKSDDNKGVEQQLSLLNDEDFIEESISVDAACSGNPGDMEYRGVYTKNGKEIFRFGPLPNGTNNIGEFLAIVHALALMKQKNSTLPVYSDSLTAIGWVRQKKANTQIPRDHTTERIWNLIERAEKWLCSNAYSNRVLKWETKTWGEIKADFGRK